MYNVETLKILNCRIYIETLKSSVKSCLLKLIESLSKDPQKCSPQNNNRSTVFLGCIWHQSMRKKGLAEVRLIHAEQMSI